MKPNTAFKLLLAVEIFSIAAVIVAIMLSHNVHDWLYEVIGALMAATITTFGIYKMRELT